MPLLQLLQMRGLWAGRRRQLAEQLQGALGGVLARAVDVLPVVPEARVDGLRAHGHDAGPGGAASCEGERMGVSWGERRRKKKVMGGLGDRARVGHWGKGTGEIEVRLKV